MKATQLLCCVAEREQLTAAQAAAALDLPLQTVYNLLNTLLAEGMLSRDSVRRYRLGPKVAMLAIAYGKIGPSERAAPGGAPARRDNGETSYLSTWRNGSVVAMAAVEGSSAVHVGGIHTELRGAEHTRASGKLMLAHLSSDALDAYLVDHRLEPRTKRSIVSEEQLRAECKTILRRGYAYDEGEFIEGVGCVAAPILNGDTCVACIGLSAPLERFKANRKQLTHAIVTAAKQASHL